jgi:cardiolipin synthase
LLHHLTNHWLFLTATIDLVVAIVASSHVVLTKRDTRATIAWVGLIWLTPLVGAFLYFLLGINRIQRRARSLRSGHRHPGSVGHLESCSQEKLDETLGPNGGYLRSLVNLVGEISKRRLLAGNCVTPLINGDQAFPAMIQAIDQSTKTVSLGTYIFDNDRIGQLFLDALKRAVSRNIKVRVLIDDMGARYSRPTMIHDLRRAGILCTTFMPPLIPWKFQYSNLRTHRKTLIVDGDVGFTGGINIREGHCLSFNPRHPIRDLQFRVEGPVVSQMQEVFADDWLFCTGEVLEGDGWFPQIESNGSVLARGIPDGPDDNFESFHHALLGAIACAEYSIRVVTPYFLPDASLITALNVAALRGIVVDIVLPKANNIPLVKWASTALLWQVVERGCRVWISPPPFDHTKLLVVDGLASFIGSSNWDPRSLRLNFELNLECYDRVLAGQLTTMIQERMDRARRLTLSELDGRTLAIKLRDGIARLASPYL